MAIEEAPDRAGRERDTVSTVKQLGKLDECDVDLSLDRGPDHVVVGLDVMRTQVASLRQGCDPTLGTPGTNPTNRSRYPNTEPLRCCIAGQPTVNSCDQSIAQIL